MDASSTSKLPGFGTTIFSVMSQLAAEHGAINLSQGYPDFDGPGRLRDLVSHHLDHGHNQYAPVFGVPGLLEQVAEKVLRLYGYAADPVDSITITPGATEALFCALSAVVSPGDEVIVLDPSYDCYVPGILLNGAKPRRIPMRMPGYSVDWQQVADAVNSRTRALMINSPHNPLGSCFGQEDIEAIRSLTRQHDLFLISDEVYEHIIFDGRDHSGLLRYPDLAERAFVISSFGKTYHVTGWRVGYCVAPASLMREFRRIHQFINFSTNAPFSYALADFMRECPEFADDLGGFYQKKRDLFLDLLKDSKFEMEPVAGTYFQTADYSQISDKPDAEFARELTTSHGVAVIPVSAFFESPPDARVVRFCFAKEDATLRQAAARLAEL